MGKIDNKLTENMQAFIANENPSEEDALKGAKMLLSLNHNAALYQTIAKRPLHFVKKIKYELNKFLPSRLDGLTINEVVKMDNELSPVIKEHITEEPSDNEAREDDEKELPLRRSGIREDHEELPPQIAKIWYENAERWKKIKKLYNTIAGIKDPCERYEFLKQEKELWYKYREEMNRYDSFRIGDEIPAEHSEGAAVDFKAINAARAYVSKNIDTLIAMKDGDDVEEYAKLRQKVQDRVNILVEAKQEFKKESIAKLRLAGIDNVPHE